MEKAGWRMDLLSQSPGQKPCVGNNLWHYLLMPLMNLTVAEEALSLSPEDRAALARLLIESLATDSRSDAEIKAELNSRLEELLSKKDEGLAFHEVFGRAS
jgi:putative addiction module component (TIGR02574 family)